MGNNNKIIVDLAGGTGAWSKKYKEFGYIVIVVTLPYYDILRTVIESEYITFKGTKELKVKISDIYGILAAPVCTMFSLARTRAKTPRDFRQGMKLVIGCLNIIWKCRYNHKLAFWCLENPMGILRQFLGKPVFTFDPCDFGDPYTKKTDLWGYFNIPKKSVIKLDKNQRRKSKTNGRGLPSISEITSSKQTAKRAITPAGFAKAFFEANK
ncbi:hypothetical protein KAX02_00565 [candidate division WOR-3 bacterium]|nr:hypothetical protein [candidate division WOR-3 bacterium]